MASAEEYVHSFVTFEELGGRPVSIEEFESEVARWSVDEVLGFVGRLSLDMFRPGRDFYEPSVQGRYLQGALVDDFPHRLLQAPYFYVPGRVPHTGDRHLLVHNQNLAMLADAAIRVAQRGVETSSFSHSLKCRMLRLLLLANDLLNPSRRSPPETLCDRRNFTIDYLKRWQFPGSSAPAKEAWQSLARTWDLYTNLLPKYFDFRGEFENATGVSIQFYLQVVAMLIAHIEKTMAPEGSQWIHERKFFDGFESRADDARRIMESWVATPDSYLESWTKWQSSHPFPDKRRIPHYDFVPLRQTPLILAKSEGWVCPVLSFLFAKIDDGPFYVLRDLLPADAGREFTKSLGLAYEDYAHNLVERIARNCGRNASLFRSPPELDASVEYADSYIQVEETGLAFEHKAQREGVNFLTGGSGDLVLGPNDEILSALENKTGAVGLGTLIRSDRGLLTKPLWQQARAIPQLLDWTERAHLKRPAEVLSFVTHYARLRVDEVCYAYMIQLVRAVPDYDESTLRIPQWLQIEDLELLATACESDGDFDVIELFRKKNVDSPAKRFDVFLYDYLGGIPRLDSRMLEILTSILEGLSSELWPTKHADRTNPHP